MRNQELGRLELSNVVLVDGSGWEDLLPLLDQWFVLCEVRLSYLSGETTGHRHRAVKGQRDFAAQARQEVKDLLAKIMKKGGCAKSTKGKRAKK